MIVRIWHTEIDPARGEEYEAFVTEYSLPMFSMQPGCLGVLFARNRHRCRVITLWSSQMMLDALERSSIYQATVARITEAGFLSGQQFTECFAVHSGDVTAQLPLAVASA